MHVLSPSIADTITPDERRQRLLELLRGQGRIVAARLGATFGVSEDTIRRDLRDLAAAGLLRRVYGGALPPTPTPASFVERERAARPRRESVAAAAAALVEDGMVVVLDVGTTNLALVRQLRPGLDATVVTSSPAIAAALAEYRNVQAILLGGRIDRASQGVVGVAAIASLGDLRADLCFLGVCGIHADFGVSASGYDDAMVKRAMIRSSQRVVAPVTAEKLGTAAAHRVAAVEELSVLIVESDLTDDVLQPYRDRGIAVVRAGAATQP